MKYQILVLAAVGLAAAQPHRHAHQHLHVERQDAPTVTDVVVAGPTVVMYSLNGQIISEADVMAGIANGTLVWANGAPVEASSAAVSTPDFKQNAYSPPTSTEAPAAPSTSATEAPASTSSAAAYSAPASSAAASSTESAPASASSASSSSGSSASGVNTPFPDGEIDCSDFPSAYGALAIDYMNLGGWSGIQSPGVSNSNGYDDIMTMNAATCSGSDCCAEGMFCSYACPVGYQKSQWPTLQGITHQSVGGLLCQNGKLHLTNPDLSSNLCIQGATAVEVQVVNEIGEQVSICRTDYPGTEAMVVPVTVNGGETQELACPDESNYYKWQGLPTSAQWYVNNAGVSVQDACVWGDGSSATGNWAPLVFGIGYIGGEAWVSMQPNTPTTTATLGYNVTLTGDNLSGKCTYLDGQFYTGGNMDSPSSSGCSLSAASGKIYYTLGGA